MNLVLFVLAMILGTLPAGPAQPAVSDPRGYICYRAASPIAVDGRLDDGAWREAPWTDDFVDIEGDKKPRPALRTRAKMLWDDSYFYIGAELVEPHLWATITRRDAVIFHENDFEFFIDPNGDNHEYYEFEINALGTGWDLLLPRPYKDGGKPVNNWDIQGLKSAVHLDGTLNDVTDTDRGWSVELAVPWTALGELARRSSPPGDGDQWRVNFSRVQWALEVSNGTYRKIEGRSENNWVWSPQHVVNMHRPETWGYVQFSTGPPGSTVFRPDASLPARRWLHDVYYAQRAFQQANRRWANSLDELRIAAPADASLSAALLQVAGGQFQASIALRVPGGRNERWNIRQDSLVWREQDP
jgi:hypothetical protein